MKLDEFIQKCIVSVPKGTYLNFEVCLTWNSKKDIVIDDGANHEPVNKATINLKVE